MNAVKPILGEVKTSELFDDDDDDDIIVEEEDKQGLSLFFMTRTFPLLTAFWLIVTYPDTVLLPPWFSCSQILLWLQLSPEVEFKRFPVSFTVSHSRGIDMTLEFYLWFWEQMFRITRRKPVLSRKVTLKLNWRLLHERIGDRLSRIEIVSFLFCWSSELLLNL